MLVDGFLIGVGIWFAFQLLNWLIPKLVIGVSDFYEGFRTFKVGFDVGLILISCFVVAVGALIFRS